MLETCEITVKGDGKGRYGHSKVDRTQPIIELLVDNEVLYREVLKHLKVAPDPEPDPRIPMAAC